MNAINISDAQNNLLNLIEDVNNRHTPITIVNDKGKNAVLISEKEWNSIKETLYLYSIPGYIDSIKKIEKEDKSTMKVYDNTFWEDTK